MRMSYWFLHPYETMGGKNWVISLKDHPSQQWIWISSCSLSGGSNGCGDGDGGLCWRFGCCECVPWRTFFSSLLTCMLCSHMNVEHGGVSWRQIRCTEESSMTAWIFLLPFFVLTYLYVVVVVLTYPNNNAFCIHFSSHNLIPPHVIKRHHS